MTFASVKTDGEWDKKPYAYFSIQKLYNDFAEKDKYLQWLV